MPRKKKTKAGWKKEQGQGDAKGLPAGETEEPIHDVPQTAAGEAIEGPSTAEGEPIGAEAAEGVGEMQYEALGMQEREAGAVVEEIGLEFEIKCAIDTPLPARPDRGGTRGTEIRLIANWFKIIIPHGCVYHYDVEIVEKYTGKKGDKVEPEKKYRCLNTRECREILYNAFSSYGDLKYAYPAYDGKKNLYTRKPLKNTPLSLDYVYQDTPLGVAGETAGRRKTYKVCVKPVRKGEEEKYSGRKGKSKKEVAPSSCAINLDSVHAFFQGTTQVCPQEALMAVETVLRNSPCLKLVPIGRSFFYPPTPDNRCCLTGGQEIWFGYHQSVRFGQCWPAVNIDISATRFYQAGPVIDFMCKILGIDREHLNRIPSFQTNQVKKLKKALQKRRIVTTHNPNYKRKHHIEDVINKPANELKFPMTDESGTKEITVHDYLLQRYGYNLRFKKLPCLQVNPKAKNIYVPIEVCNFIEGQHCKEEATNEQKNDMIKFTSCIPATRFKEINDIVRNADFKNDAYCKAFDLSVSPEPARLKARVLDAPQVCYGMDKTMAPKGGQWDMRNQEFFAGASIKNWMVLNCSSECSYQALRKFSDKLAVIAAEKGLHIAGTNEIQSLIIQPHHSLEAQCNLVRSIFKKAKIDFAVVIIPKKNQTLHGVIKEVTETELGIITQCVKDDKVHKCDASVLSNLSQKINAKMGGVNNSLSRISLQRIPEPAIFGKPVIIIGADVTHPAPTETVKPSFAAVVGSVDRHPSRYAVTCRAQVNIDEKKQAIEIILELKSMVIDILKAFYRETRHKPEKIIFYRDGVSEGQFQKVRYNEVAAIREACTTLEAAYQPGITFIVVQKRHHTRFYPERGEGLGRCGNVPPGTVVDNTVVHPTNFDFFLASQFGLQGTSRPAHYTVIEDDNEFKSDQLQMLTYYLCYTYVRCTKSISVPPPVMYAHLAAFRAKEHYMVHMNVDDSSEDTVSQYGEVNFNVVNVLKQLQSTMYFV